MACREDQNEYIPYHVRPFTLGQYQPTKTLTRLIDLIPYYPAEIALRQKGYPFPAALRTEQGQQWWLRYSAARKIYAITVKPEDRAALPFDRSYPDAGTRPAR